jgi:hypothetical protein
MTRVLTVIALGSVTMLAIPSHAQSLKEKKLIRQGQAKLDETTGDLKKKCGVEIKMSLDWKSFKGKDKGSYGLPSAFAYCGNVADGVRSVCGDEDGKPAIAKSVKTISCKWDAKATKAKLKRYGPVMSLKGGKLTAGYNWDTANMSSSVRDWLMNNL